MGGLFYVWCLGDGKLKQSEITLTHSNEMQFSYRLQRTNSRFPCADSNACGKDLVSSLIIYIARILCDKHRKYNSIFISHMWGKRYVQSALRIAFFTCEKYSPSPIFEFASYLVFCSVLLDEKWLIIIKAHLGSLSIFLDWKPVSGHLLVLPFAL